MGSARLEEAAPMAESESGCATDYHKIGEHPTDIRFAARYSSLDLAFFSWPPTERHASISTEPGST